MLYYIKRIKQLGLTKTLSRINNNIHKQLYKLYWKQKAIDRGVNYRCERLKTQSNFKKFINNQKEAVFIENILSSTQFKQHIPSKDYCTQQANNAAQKHFYILGSSKQCFKNIPWQDDFKLTRQTNNNHKTFYQDIKITTQKNAQLSNYNFDIKVPWELSRFQHIFYLGYTYKRTKNPIYAQAFEQQASDWIKKNPFLLGVNWVCPMDVAIRAINFIWGFHFFKDCKEIEDTFWHQFFTSLYNHAKYLENNLETSDKPNNHYLADLLGYFYLSFIFDDLRKDWCYSQILSQFEHQVLPDATCYEGSTSYHKLVTEIFWHFYLLCRENNIILPASFLTKLNKMFLFLQDCNNVQIGDNDSGKILLGFSVQTPPYGALRVRDAASCSSGRTELNKLHDYNPLNKLKFFVNKQHKQNISGNKISEPFALRSSLLRLEPVGRREAGFERVAHYPNFGLTSIRTNNAHITFRHPTYNSKQPTGHFHQDELAITLSINAIPVLVDPGTYLYTANPTWRNKMRSVESHNTFYLKEVNELGNNLFQLPKIEQHDTAIIKESLPDASKDAPSNYSNQPLHSLMLSLSKHGGHGAWSDRHGERIIEIENYHDKYKKYGLRAYRKLTWNKNEKILEIKDWFEPFKPCLTSFGTKGSISRETRYTQGERLDENMHAQNAYWNLTFHPEIKLEQLENGNWLIKHKNNLLATLESNLEFEIEQGFYSSEYGRIEKCTKLVGEQKTPSPLRLSIKFLQS